MKHWTGILILTSMGLMMALPVQAKRDGRGIEDRMDRQQHAIQRGIDSGNLTRREARLLKREQREIRHFGEQIRHEGYSPKKGRKLMKKRLRRSDRHIKDLLHNREHTYGRDDNRRYPPPYSGGYDKHYPRSGQRGSYR